MPLASFRTVPLLAVGPLLSFGVTYQTFCISMFTIQLIIVAKSQLRRSNERILGLGSAQHKALYKGHSVGRWSTIVLQGP